MLYSQLSKLLQEVFFLIIVKVFLLIIEFLLVIISY